MALASVMDLTSKLLVKLTGIATKTTYSFEAPSMNVEHNFSKALADGDALDAANQIYQDEATMLASAEASYDLSGALVDIFGTSVTFTKVKGIIFVNTSTLASTLRVGGGTGMDGTNAFDTWITSNTPGFAGSEGVFVAPGGCFVLFNPTLAGYAVTGGSVDKLVIKETSALAASFELTIVGVM